MYLRGNLALKGTCKSTGSGQMSLEGALSRVRLCCSLNSLKEVIYGIIGNYKQRTVGVITGDARSLD